MLTQKRKRKREKEKEKEKKTLPYFYCFELIFAYQFHPAHFNKA